MLTRKLLAVAVLVAAVVGQLGLEVAWAHSAVVLAQVGEEEEVSQEEADQGGGGQSDPEAETGSGEEEAATEEEGPPWTYQMARLSLGLILLSALGLGWLYYRMILSRQRART